MATRIRLMRRLYSGVPGAVKKAAGYIKKNPTLPIVTTSLGVTSANMANTKKRNQQEEVSRGKYIDALNRLSNSLEKAEKVIEAEPIKKEETPNKQRTLIIKRRK